MDRYRASKSTLDVPFVGGRRAGFSTRVAGYDGVAANGSRCLDFCHLLVSSPAGS